MPRSVEVGLLALLLAGCDPAQTLTLHNDLNEEAQVAVRFHISDNKPENVEEDRLDLLPREAKEAVLTWSTSDWVGIAWRSAHHVGTRRFQGAGVPRNEADLHLTPGGIALGPLSPMEAFDESLGATKPFVCAALGLGLVFGFRRWVISQRSGRGRSAPG